MASHAASIMAALWEWFGNVARTMMKETIELNCPNEA